MSTHRMRMSNSLLYGQGRIDSVGAGLRPAPTAWYHLLDRSLLEARQIALDRQERRAWAPVRVQNTERSLLVVGVALTGPTAPRSSCSRGTSRQPTACPDHRGTVSWTSFIASTIYVALLLGRDEVTELIARGVVRHRPAKLGDPDLMVAHTLFDHEAAHILKMPEVVGRVIGPAAQARAGSSQLCSGYRERAYRAGWPRRRDGPPAHRSDP